MPLIQPLDYLIELCELLTGQHGGNRIQKVLHIGIVDLPRLPCVHQLAYQLVWRVVGIAVDYIGNALDVLAASARLLRNGIIFITHVFKTAFHKNHLFDNNMLVYLRAVRTYQKMPHIIKHNITSCSARTGDYNAEDGT